MTFLAKPHNIQPAFFLIRRMMGFDIFRRKAGRASSGLYKPAVSYSISNSRNGAMLYFIIFFPFFHSFRPYIASSLAFDPLFICFFPFFAIPILLAIFVVAFFTSRKRNIVFFMPIKLRERFYNFALSAYSCVFHRVILLVFVIICNHFQMKV